VADRSSKSDKPPTVERDALHENVAGRLSKARMSGVKEVLARCIQF
jgi:hypothetical protein